MSFNSNSPTMKRLISEFRAIRLKPEDNFVAGPIGDDLFVWHFTIKGPPDTAFEGGIYHGKIIFPQLYPFAPPDICFLTPNGRFEIRKKICLSITSYHPDSWNPAWDVRTALTAIIAMMPTKAEGAIGGIDMTDYERKILAKQSQSWRCNECEYHIDPDPIKDENIPDKLPENTEQAQQTTEEDKNDEMVKEEVDNEINDEINTDENIDEQNQLKEEEVVEKVVRRDTAPDILINQEEIQENNAEHFDDEIPDKPEEQVEEVNIYDEEGRRHYKYETLQRSPNDRQVAFLPLYDIPIIILFVLLTFLIFNSTFGFVNIFPK